MFLFATASFLLCAIFYYFWSQPTDVPIFDVYHQKSFRFYVKKILVRILLKYRKREPMRNEDAEKLQPFSSDSMAIDAVYFNTSSPDKSILVFNTGRRKCGLVNTLGFLKMPQFSDQLLVLPVFPDTCLYQTESEQETMDYYTVAGIKLTPVIPMKEWHVEYDGKMRLENDSTKLFNVQINAKWTSTLLPFNYSTDISEIAMSEAMALEPWSKKYFQNLESHHQTHFEQYGELNGTVNIDGADYVVHTRGLRDHTFGFKRNWKDFHRYVIHFFQLENGDGITIGVVSAPVMFSRLVIGFISSAEDKTNTAIDKCDIELYQFGDQPPDQYAFTFWSNDNRYVVEVKTHTKTEVYMGEESECRLVEKWCDFKVNGIYGWGAAEWQFRHHDGLPVSQQK